MWRTTPRLATTTLAAAAALALALTAAPQARAASVQSYDTAAVQSYTDTITGGISGPSNGPITFNPQSYPGTFTTPGSITLGQFLTNPLPTTATLTYNNTPFWVDLNVAGVPQSQSPGGYPSYHGPGPNHYQYQIAGLLNGTIGGDGSSSMIATVTSITGSGSGLATSPPFSASDLKIGAQGIAAPNGYSQGITTLTAQVQVVGLPLPSPAPEPSTIAAFGLALAGWACRRRPRPRA